jgi:hypothetical protein
MNQKQILILRFILESLENLTTRRTQDLKCIFSAFDASDRKMKFALEGVVHISQIADPSERSAATSELLKALDDPQAVLEARRVFSRIETLEEHAAANWQEMRDAFS